VKGEAKMVARVMRASQWLSAIGDRAEAGDGFNRALVRSNAAEMAVSVDDADGIKTWDGCHVRVSVIRSAPVEGMKVVKQR
jgi:hypothetical protein